MTRADLEARASYYAARRAERIAALLSAPDTRECEWCGGSGELPHEDTSRECDGCYGTGLALAPPPPDEAQPDTVVRGVDLVGTDAEVEAFSHELGLRARKARSLRLRERVAAMRGVWR